LYVVPVVLTIVVLCVVLEAGARLLLPDNTNIWPTVYDPTVGIIFTPNAIVRHTNGLDYDVTDRTNAAGFLDRPLPPVEKAPGECRVAFIGDSYIEAAQVKMDDKVQVQFERLARQAWPGINLRTMAFGRSGTGQVNQLSYYDQVARKYKPDVVVLALVPNDLGDNSALITALAVGYHPYHAPVIFARDEPGGKIELQPIDPKWGTYALPWPVLKQPWWHEKLNASSRFYQWLFLKMSLLYPSTVQNLGWILDQRRLYADRKMHLRALAPEFAKAVDEIDRPDITDASSLVTDLYHKFSEGEEMPAPYAQAVRFTSFGFDEFKRRAQTDGFDLVTLAVVGIGGKLNAQFKAMIEPKGIPYLSQNDYLDSLGEPLSSAFWPHDGHWNERGHLRAAEQLLHHFAQTGLCGHPPKPL
jgi:hypothetical protein